MSTYAPHADMQFVMNELAGLEQVAKLPGCEEATPDLVDAVLEEAAKFATEVLAPLNRPAIAMAPSGSKDGSGHDADGLQGGLRAVRRWRLERPHQRPASTAARDCRNSSRPRSRRCGTPRTWLRPVPAADPGRDRGDRAARHGRAQGDVTCPRWSPATWTGTMNLTEPQAGSDLAAGAHARGAARRRHYKLYGQKIFITYGEHDMTENIIHLVLARTPDAPGGRQGHLAVRRAQVPGQRGRHARARATTSTACRSSTSSASTRARPR